MARWRLRQAHYLNVPGTEWEYKETDKETGKQARVVFPVPLLLDPDQPSDHNYPGEIIVAQGEGTYPHDIIFVGDPTPDMEPLDAEAEKISAKVVKRGRHPIESLPSGMSHSEALLASLDRQLAALAKNAQVEAVNPVSVSAEDFAKLQEQVAALSAKNAELQEKLGKRRAI